MKEYKYSAECAPKNYDQWIKSHDTVWASSLEEAQEIIDGLCEIEGTIIDPYWAEFGPKAEEVE